MNFIAQTVMESEFVSSYRYVGLLEMEDRMNLEKIFIMIRREQLSFL